MGADGATPYHLNVAVDEVSLTFHAADIDGVAIDDLRWDELNLLGNGKPPRKIVAFQPIRDLPIRAGILIDKREYNLSALPWRRMKPGIPQTMWARLAEQWQAGRRATVNVPK